MPRSLTLQGCFARVPSAKPNIQTTTKSAGLAFKGDTLASCPARGARACSGKTAVSFNDDPKVALGGFGSSRCALGRLQLVHCRGLCARRWGRWCWGAEFGPLVCEEFENENGERKSQKTDRKFWPGTRSNEHASQWKGNLSYTKHQAYVSWFGLSPSYTKKEPPMTDRLSRNSPCSCPPQNSSGSCEASPWRTSTACSAHEQSQSSDRQRGIE